MLGPRTISFCIGLGVGALLFYNLKFTSAPVTASSRVSRNADAPSAFSDPANEPLSRSKVITATRPISETLYKLDQSLRTKEFHDSGKFRLLLREAFSKDEQTTWQWIREQRSTVDSAAFQELLLTTTSVKHPSSAPGYVEDVMRFSVPKAKKPILTQITLSTATPEALEKLGQTLEKSADRSLFLEYLSGKPIGGSWIESADFLLRQNLNSTDKDRCLTTLVAEACRAGKSAEMSVVLSDGHHSDLDAGRLALILRNPTDTNIAQRIYPLIAKQDMKQEAARFIRIALGADEFNRLQGAR